MTFAEYASQILVSMARPFYTREGLGNDRKSTIVEMKVDIHNHILPASWPDLKKVCIMTL